MVNTNFVLKHGVIQPTLPTHPQKNYYFYFINNSIALYISNTCNVYVFSLNTDS